MYRWRRRRTFVGMHSTIDRDTSIAAPSRTAMLAACARGAHLLRHQRRAVLDDWLAWALVGAEAEATTAGLRAMLGDAAESLATWMAARSRITEEWLDASEVEQYLVLGAGLDSFAWRRRGTVRVLEVDHPATQEWKRSRLAALDIRSPAELVWAPVDFETESLAAGLVRAGLMSRSTFASWLGVTNYLAPDAISATLRDLPPCLLAVTYGAPKELWPPDAHAPSTLVQALARDSGEPWISLFTPEQFSALLARSGFTVLEDLGPQDVEHRYGLHALSLAGERIVLATNTA